jgi:hypothetical protein
MTTTNQTSTLKGVKPLNIYRQGETFVQGRKNEFRLE